MPFPDEPPARPPETLLAFYGYFIKPVWPAFAVLLVAGFARLADRGERCWPSSAAWST